ncbi:MAG: His-Xaa-Ser system radical SAM maturase HxsB [Candidatus Omnitrophica bacterium]|nr:His-Xaa-Ser system radical SAM maturase HxsB [Candidatus Omnitrophota bacterium]
MKRDFAITPFNSMLIKDKYLVSNMLGAWDFLDKGEFEILNSYRLKRDIPFFKRLYDKRIVVDEHNLNSLLQGYRNLNSNLFNDTSLHIAVLTTRCNLSCKYCQTKSVKGKDMDYEVATRILKYVTDVRSQSIILEFQGGEPLLNWEILAFLVVHAREINKKIKKNLNIALVSNLTLLDEEKIKFLIKNDVAICASLDGPQNIHDKNRVFKGGKGSYGIITKNIRKLKDKFGKKVRLLPTITKFSLKHHKEIIDEYVNWQEEEIAIRPVNKMGTACLNWNNLGYSAEQFIEFYKNSLDYMLELNKSGVSIRERVTRVILEKVLGSKDPGYVELMNPCGAGRSTIVYMPDGSCYPCDEARMIGEEMFKLGNILKENYENLMTKENLIHLLESSLVNLWDYKSPFSPWMGTCPVVNYALQKNMVPKIWCSPIHKIYTHQFRYIFEKILEDEENLNIFKSWIGGRGYEEKKK